MVSIEEWNPEGVELPELPEPPLPPEDWESWWDWAAIEAAFEAAA